MRICTELHALHVTLCVLSHWCHLMLLLLLPGCQVRLACGHLPLACPVLPSSNIWVMSSSLLVHVVYLEDTLLIYANVVVD